MARNYSELRAKMNLESRARSEALALEMLAVMDLAELRKAQNISQGELAERLDKGQPAVAKVESREDPHVSTVREYIEALGGRLDLVAHMPNNESILLKRLSSDNE
jgi:transcriptional regulator with XRE-family HTH domain